MICIALTAGTTANMAANTVANFTALFCLFDISLLLSFMTSRTCFPGMSQNHDNPIFYGFRLRPAIFRG